MQDYYKNSLFLYLNSYNIEGVNLTFLRKFDIIIPVIDGTLF